MRPTRLPIHDRRVNLREPHHKRYAQVTANRSQAMHVDRGWRPPVSALTRMRDAFQSGGTVNLGLPPRAYTHDPTVISTPKIISTLETIIDPPRKPATKFFRREIYERQRRNQVRDNDACIISHMHIGLHLRMDTMWRVFKIFPVKYRFQEHYGTQINGRFMQDLCFASIL